MHRHRACWEGSWEGGGSLVGAGDSVVPVGRGRDVSRWNWHHGVVQFMVFLTVWRNFYRGDPETRDSGFTVAGGSVAPVRL